MNKFDRVDTPLDFYAKMKQIDSLDVSDEDKLLMMSSLMSDTLWDLGYCSGIAIFNKIYVMGCLKNGRD